MSHEHTTPAGESHGSTKSYIVGFILSAVLTLIPFGLVMYGVLPKPVTLLLIVAFAVIQIVVQLVYFLHMNRHSESGWNLMSFIFTVVIVVIVVVLSIWIIWNMHYNMMIH
ncbi:cytochrome o ubiquinol oxidase subunit IV [Corticimicrobacter populi]|uniref:Cytochrome bo(3) ubiquinol oxidase subunit 4 n=1 Tax=Corticimicrobacter populi TaxID=2175229 RepID=A0A2V1K334_9BURK|nr:cytochrome o ubiquinol oxidase subunit IV [Corticimicrobacter populi]PWF24633.1 cytochrome o ubiquinol oxidase subunit IV [Corticimicrobacter populi]QDQ86648.1 cytochrome o ubiquinol oxidase subunit IV [Alcaligenaceae bacterium SJ-26]